MQKFLPLGTDRACKSAPKRAKNTCVQRARVPTELPVLRAAVAGWVRSSATLHFLTSTLQSSTTFTTTVSTLSTTSCYTTTAAIATACSRRKRRRAIDESVIPVGEGGVVRGEELAGEEEEGGEEEDGLMSFWKIQPSAASEVAEEAAATARTEELEVK